MQSPQMLSQVACTYRFEFSKDYPYQPLPKTSATHIIATGADQPSDQSDLSPTDEEFFPDIPIGFPFNFNGKIYTGIGICTNGWIWVGKNNPVKAGGLIYPYINVLAANHSLEGVIAALNGDLEGRWSSDGATLKTLVQGNYPHRRFIVEWNNFKSLDDAEGTGYCGEKRNRFDFQIILEETTNRIIFAYNTDYCWQGYDRIFQVGLRGPSLGDVHARSVSSGDKSWEVSQPGNPLSTVRLKSSAPVTLPPLNTRYIFIPDNSGFSEWLGITTEWSDPLNWSGKAVPNRCTDILIPSGKTNYPEITGVHPVVCASLQISKGASLTISSSFASCLSVFGDLTNDGKFINNSNSYVALSGGAGSTISGTGQFHKTDFFLTEKSTYSLHTDLLIRSMFINHGSSLNLNKSVLDVFSLVQKGNLNQNQGLLVIEGDPSSVIFTDSTFDAGQGTTFFGSGEIWSEPVDQVVPSLPYNHLWVRTNKGRNVQIGNGNALSCANLLFSNPGEPGGKATTGADIYVNGDFSLGIEKFPGTDLQIHHTIYQIADSGVFNMDSRDILNISAAPENKKPALVGFLNPDFRGDVNYTGNRDQSVVNGSYQNISISGNAVRSIMGATHVSGIMRLEQGTINTSDSLICKADSLNTALILSDDEAKIHGMVYLERYIPGNNQKSVLFSSAFQESSLGDYLNLLPGMQSEGFQGSENNPLKAWDYLGDRIWDDFSTNWIADFSLQKDLKIGRAYLTNLDGSSLIRSKGSVFSGESKNVVNATISNRGFNLIGNPFPSPIDWNKLLIHSKAKISGTLYKMATGNRYNGNYASWLALDAESGFGINGASRYVSAMEGFFVKAFESDTLTLKNSMRVPVLNTNKPGKAASLPFFKLSLIINEKSDETLIYYHQNCNNKAVSHYMDAEKMPAMHDNHFWYSIKDSVKLGIQGRKNCQFNDSIPMGMKITNPGKYTIRLTEISNLPSTSFIWLEDKKNGSFHDLKRFPDYEVFLNPGEITERFFIHYNPGILVKSEKGDCISGKGRISLSNFSDRKWDFKIMNSNDSLIYSRDKFSGSCQVSDLPPDDYLVHFVIPEMGIEADEWIQILQADKAKAVLETNSLETEPGKEILFKNTGTNEGGVFWDFGDGRIASGDSVQSHYYQYPGNYKVILSVSNHACIDTASLLIHVSLNTGLNSLEKTAENKISVFPNPATDLVHISLPPATSVYQANISLLDAMGKIIREFRSVEVKPDSLIDFPVGDVPPGNYQLLINAAEFRGAQTLSVGSKR